MRASAVPVTPGDDHDRCARHAYVLAVGGRPVPAGTSGGGFNGAAGAHVDRCSGRVRGSDRRGSGASAAGDIRLLPERVAGAYDDRLHLSDGTSVEPHSVRWCGRLREDHAWGDAAGGTDEEGCALHVWPPSRVPALRLTRLLSRNRRKSRIMDGVDCDARITVDRTRAALAGSGPGNAA